MKLSYVAGLLGLSAAVDRRDVSDLVPGLPACSLSCFTQAAQTFGCDPQDISCRCEKEVQMTATMERCLQRSCSDQQKQFTEGLSREICKIQLQHNTLYKKSPAAAPEPVADVVVEAVRREYTATASFPATASSIPASSIFLHLPTATGSTTAPVVTAAAAAIATPVVALAGVAALGALFL